MTKTPQLLRWLTVSIVLSVSTGAFRTAAGEQMQEGVGMKPPYQVLFSNDNTNILICESPYHQLGQPINMDMFAAAIDETADTGIDVHMLQPGFTWVPFWQSDVYPIEEHVKWWKSRYPDVGITEYNQLVLDGNDFIAAFIKRCNEKGLTPFVSLRLNDKHLLNEIDAPDKTRAPEKYWAATHIGKFYVDHLDYRIGADKNDQYQRVHNWAIPEVREHKYAFIEEICQKYDIAGLELDFMRHPNFFRLHETSRDQRRQIMVDFIGRVRELLDRTARGDAKRWLCVRVPQYLACHDGLGVDLQAFQEAGVDMFNLSGYFFTDQQGDLQEIAQLIPDAAKYLELTHCSAIGKTVAQGSDNFEFRRTTDEQFYTTAHLAYAAGFDGVSTFNLHYYRRHGAGANDRGPYNEPPFHVFKSIGDKEWVARQPQHYFLGKIWNNPRKAYVPLPQRLAPGRHYIAFHIQMAPPTGGWTKDARMRFQIDGAWSGQKLIVRFNNTNLRSTKNIAEPYKIPYEAGIGKPQQYRGYRIPKELLARGLNQLEIKFAAGEPVDLIYIDIAAE